MKRLKHFDYKPFKIYGTTKEEYKQLLKPYKQPSDRKVIGQWVDARIKYKSVYTLFKKNGTIYLEDVIVTTEPNVNKVKLTRFKGGIKITDDDYNDPNSLKEFLFFTSGQMQFWNNEGHFLTLDQTTYEIKQNK